MATDFASRATKSGVYVKFYPAALDRLLKGPNGPVGQDLARSAVRVESAAKRLCPVDTGRLRSSITHEIGRDGKGLIAYIGSSVHYAAHVEFGTRFMRPQPYLRPALRAAR